MASNFWLAAVKMINKMLIKDKINIEVDLPVFNEQDCLQKNAERLIDFLKSSDFNYSWRIVIIDNGSTDNTLAIAEQLKERYPEVDYLKLTQKGRGRALCQAWLKSQADIVSYMDIDLATDLAAFPALIDVVANQGFDLATGSRMMKESKVKRSFKREVLSRGYIFLLRHFLHVNFLDAQCGFKALNRKVIENILPQVLDQQWFFDSELLIKCQRYGYRIKEIPIQWTEDKGSKVEIFKTVGNYIFSVLRLKKEFKNYEK
ncbi:MAG: dolichyl-phosphate beta-glucosyltransferase [Patescibacteria group bacterium]|jgi:glycosyltransferase involved in cell wall biosynthesis